MTSTTKLLLRKTRTVIRNPKRGILRFLRRMLQFYSKRRLQALNYDGLFDRRPPEAYPPNWADLWYLYKLVRKRKPSVILEFGAGCSTYIFAQALLDNRRQSSSEGHIFSVDGEEKWAEIARQAMPDHLREVSTISYSPLAEVEYMGVQGFKYVDVPTVTPDFVYVDGPTLTEERQVIVDILDIESRFPVGTTLVVDGRTQQCEFLKEHLKAEYSIRHNLLLFNTVFRKMAD